MSSDTVSFLSPEICDLLGTCAYFRISEQCSETPCPVESRLPSQPEPNTPSPKQRFACLGAGILLVTSIDNDFLGRLWKSLRV